MLKNIKKRNEGFTIIEVLIVLAIAGLILLVVFLAVPALQRNSRNQQRKQDVAAMLSAVTEWSNNNSGKMPSNTTEQGEALANAKLGYYDAATAGVVVWGTSATPNAADVEKVVIATKSKCGTTSGTAAAGGSRQIVALYTVESGSGKTNICQES